MIQNLAENEKYTINYFKDGQRKSIDLLGVLNNGAVGESSVIMDVIYETDGTDGLLGLNKSNISGNWQLEKDFSQYKSIKCFFKQSDHDLANKSLTPPIVIELPLDESSLAKTVVNANIGSIKTPCDIYIGGVSVGMVNDITSLYRVTVAVDGEKKRFKVVDQYIISGDNNIKFANNEGRYLYKIIGIK